MEPILRLPDPIPSKENPEHRNFQKAVLRLVKGGPERLAVEAGEIDAIIDPVSGSAILLPEAQRALIERTLGDAAVHEPARYARATLDALAVPVGVLDQAGVVLLTNRAWHAGVAPAGIGVGIRQGASYLDACDQALGNERVDGIAIAAGIRQVLAAERGVFRYEHACGMPAGRRWFMLNCTGVGGDAAARAVVSIEDVSEQKRGELLLALEYTVARCLSDAGSAGAAVQAVIRAVCETQGWDCGRYFRLDRAAGVLYFDQSWGVPTAAVEQFLEKSRGLVVRPGAGLTGRVCQSGLPLWVSDGKRDAAVSPTALAPETGEGGAFVFPVMADDRTIGVLAFSNRVVREPDDRTLQAVRSIGSQLGRFLQRQQALDTLRRNEARFRGLVGVSSDWYWEQDRDCRFIEWVGSGVAGAGEVLGKTYWELPNVVAGDISWAEHKSQLGAQWSFCDFEFAAVHPDGLPGYYCISGEPVYDEAGRLTGYRGIGLDITERKRAEIALRESETHLRGLAGSSPG